MQQHGPTELNGPVRGSRGWWQGLGEEPPLVETESCDQPDSVQTKRPRRSKRSVGRGIPPDRQQLIDRVRGEIAAGTYDSPQKWEAALDRLLDRLERD